jgi:hypothetical protein
MFQSTLTSAGSTVVEHSPHYPKVNGSSRAAAAGTGFITKAPGIRLMGYFSFKSFFSIVSLQLAQTSSQTELQCYKTFFAKS